MELILSLLPDGKGILSTEDRLSQEAVAILRWRYKEWAESEAGLFVLANCRVQRVTELTLELDQDGITAVP